MNRPNIILITWHDLGDFLGCYGHRDVASPCLDQLAREGALFEDYFCTAPQCSPSRASIVTGLMPHSTGVLGLTHRGFDMGRGMTTLPQIMRRSGYSTHLIGLQHECRDPKWEGYDDVRAQGKGAKSAADQAIAFLREPRRKPFFLAIGTNDVHRPHGDDCEPEVFGRVQLPPYLPQEDIARTDMAIFYRRIREADEQMGRIAAALDDSALAADTILVFTTDHGAAIPRAKQTLFDQGLRTALIARWPGHIEAGLRRDALLSNVDLMPTLLDLIGVAARPGLHGRSFGSLLLGQPYEPRDAIFAELTWHCHYRPMRAIRTATHKLVVNFCPGLPMLVEDGPIRRYGPELIDQHYSEPRPEEELYDLAADPWEQRNVAANPAYAPVKASLRGRLMEFLESTDDPILRGAIPNPEPERTKREFWIEEDGRFRIDPNGDWNALKA